jgi:serine/threonine-protein kinase HipA
MTRKGKVFLHDRVAGIIEETDAGTFRFAYDPKYLAIAPPPPPVSLTLPLRGEIYESRTLFAFFDGLIPEGWLLDISVRHWKLSTRDRMGLLLEACGDCIGAVSVVRIDD